MLSTILCPTAKPNCDAYTSQGNEISKLTSYMHWGQMTHGSAAPNRHWLLWICGMFRWMQFFTFVSAFWAMTYRLSMRKKHEKIQLVPQKTCQKHVKNCQLFPTLNPGISSTQSGSTRGCHPISRPAGCPFRVLRFESSGTTTTILGISLGMVDHGRCMMFHIYMIVNIYFHPLEKDIPIRNHHF